MTARNAVEPCQLIRPPTAIPLHREGWKHLKKGRKAIEREFVAESDNAYVTAEIPANRRFGPAVLTDVRAAGRWQLERDPYLLETSVSVITRRTRLRLTRRLLTVRSRDGW